MAGQRSCVSWLTLCCVLCISSLASRPNEGRFWHVTDFHYDHTYTTSHLSCSGEAGRRSPLGDYWCDSPWTLVTAAIQAMATYDDDVDFVLWTGDTVAHISDDDLSTTVNMEVVQNLTTALATAFPDKTVYAAFGNHDYYPASQFPAVGDFIYNHTAHMWSDWIVEEEQLDNFRKGGYYTRLLPATVSHALRMVVLNTNLYYTSDRATQGVEDPAGQFRWLRAVLQRAKDNNEKVIVAGHIPPGIHTPKGVQWYQEDFVPPFIAILKDFADVIKAMHFGHDHYDGFKVFYNKKGEAAVPIFVAPSVTPWRYKLSDGDTGLPHNPSVRLVTYDRATGDHLNIQQFRLDLAAATSSPSNDQAAAQFSLLYSFTEHYKVDDISAASLDSLVTRMGSQAEGSSLLNDYYRFSLAGAAGAGCDAQCKVRIVCGFRHYNKSEYDTCTARNACDARHDTCTDDNSADTGAASRVLAPLSCVASVLIMMVRLTV